MVTEAKVWAPEEIKTLLKTNDAMVCRSLLKLYGLQTRDEKTSMYTRWSNGVGFNGIDAHILSSFAEQYDRKNWLSEKQISLARKKLVKYTKQLVKIANGEA